MLSEGPLVPSQMYSTPLMASKRFTSTRTQHMRYTTCWIHPSIPRSYMRLESLGILFPWMKENANHRIFLHHVPDCEDYVFEPHHTVHRLATSTKIEAGGALLQTIAFSTKQITDFVMSDWANQFRLSQYVGQHFMYPRWSVNRQDHCWIVICHMTHIGCMPCLQVACLLGVSPRES